MNNKSTTFHEYQKRPYQGRNPPIKKTQFKRFREFDANSLAYAFLDILNGLNLLSVIYDGKIFPRYEENLSALEKLLRDVLSKLVNGLGEEGDIYSMMYKLDSNNKYSPIDVLRIQKYEPGCGLDALISRSFGQQPWIERDFNRSDSITDVLDLLEEVDNLRRRAISLESIQLPDSPEVAALQDALFEKRSA